MRVRVGTAVAVAVGVLLAGAGGARADVAPSLTIRSTAAETWTPPGGTEQVIVLTGPVTITAGDVTMTAAGAVVWIDHPGGVHGPGTIDVALVGDAAITAPDHTRTADRLHARFELRGPITMESQSRLARDASGTPLFRAAEALRRSTVPVAAPPSTRIDPASKRPPTTSATAPPRVPQLPPDKWTINLRSTGVRQTATEDGRIAVVVDGLVMVVRWGNGDLAEMQANRAVLFTPFKSIDGDVLAKITSAEQAVEAVYLEGDVRVNVVPVPDDADADGRPDGDTVGPQRLRARSAYFELASRKGVLTQAVLHTTAAARPVEIPLVLRARTIRQLSAGEYAARDVRLTTSAFRRPSYELQMQRIHVRPRPATGGGTDTKTSFTARNTFFKFFGVPLFYLPATSGTPGDNRVPIREFRVGSSSVFGESVRTEWGLFETLGLERPDGLDAAYQLDFYSDRGPAGGLTADYRGGLVTETSRQPWNFNGSLDSYVVNDRNQDQLGGSRNLVPPEPDATFNEWPEDVRGFAVWRHQHFFPDDWQVQLQGAYVSDATFREQWREDEFAQGLPLDESLYVKRQRGTEAFTFGANWQPNEVVTISDYQQEQFEVERLPELTYHHTGDGLGTVATSYLDASASALSYEMSDVSLIDQGFSSGVLPGLPSLGQTGVTDDVVYRADLREQVDFPLSAGPVRIVPYVMGRYTGYTESPALGPVDRVIGAAGARVTTAFWRVNDRAHSDLFDVHRVRHVVEPELHLFGAAGNRVGRGDVYIFDEPVDGVTTDLSAAQLAIRQRWQTKRGGAGRWRNVDVVTFDLEYNEFADVPDDDVFVQPLAFRGLYFPSLPEASVARDGINADAAWRISDTTVLLADAAYNLDEDELATAAIGLAVRAGDRLLWSVGTRYIDLLDSNVTTVSVDYRLSEKYAVAAAQSFDFGQAESVGWRATVTRKFDRFVLEADVAYNVTDDIRTFGINFVPEFLGVGSRTVSGFAGQDE